MTTQQAADLLHVSHLYLVKLLNEGKIPFRTVGKYRRVRFDDLMDFKRKDDAVRAKIADELAAEGAGTRIGLLTDGTDDRHVLAAAIRADAQVIVTFILSDLRIRWIDLISYSHLPLDNLVHSLEQQGLTHARIPPPHTPPCPLLCAPAVRPRSCTARCTARQSRDRRGRRSRGGQRRGAGRLSGRRERALAGVGPVVLFDGDEIVFRYGESRRASKITPALYTDLKSVSHVALGLAALLYPAEDRPLDPARLFALKAYQGTINKAREAIRHRDFTKNQRQRQERLLADCGELLTEVLRDKKIDPKTVVPALRKLRLPLELNSAEATRAQIDSLHREMTAYRAKLSEEEWHQLRVIVQGSAMPRKRNMAVQYFARLLGEKGEGRRILYAEALYDETRALALLGTQLLDTQLGADVYDDPLRLHRDLLADATKGYLDELFK